MAMLCSQMSCFYTEELLFARDNLNEMKKLVNPPYPVRGLKHLHAFYFHIFKVLPCTEPSSQNHLVSSS
jgi:hypothetical protein